MGVEHYWRRTSTAAIRDLGPDGLFNLVPEFFDDRFAVERREGLVVVAESTGDLLRELLRLGATDHASTAAVTLFRRPPPNWDDDWMVGSHAPGTVSQIAAFFAGAPLDHWLEQHRVTLAAKVEDIGYGGWAETSWAPQLLRDAQDVAALFGAAAASDEAVIIKISA
ncbi:hypothetical protein [Dactylosporangium darangshiense]|uniref:DUF1877 family protein n=1 Tax=Dactylosporangium darangshiense TaxID=579108 RepID=A0ABP8CVJ2_9ACTN